MSELNDEGRVCESVGGGADSDIDLDESASDDVDSMSDSDAEEDIEKCREKIKDLQKQLSSWPRFYDGHVELIQTLCKAGELLEAREAREQMNKHYPLSPELWLEWIQNEKAVATTPEERAVVSSLLDRATKDYASLKVWTEYLLYSVGGGDIEATRAVAERALAAVGTHVRDGELLWQSITCIEEEVYAGLSGEAKDEHELTPQQQQQKKRLQALYRRRFRVPLLNMDEDALLADAEKWFDGQTEPYMKSDLSKSIEKLAVLEPYEEKLLQTEEDDESNVVAYNEYLKHAKAKDGPAQVQNLYERAVLRHPLNDGLWLDYVEWCSEKFGDQTSLTLPVAERSVRNCPWSGLLCSLYVDTLQRDHPAQNFRSMQPKIKDVVEACLMSLAGVDSRAVALHGSQMWLSYVLFLARRLRHTASCEDNKPTLGAGSPLKQDHKMDCSAPHGAENGTDGTQASPSDAPTITKTVAVSDDAEDGVERQLERLREACRRGIQMMRDSCCEDGSSEGDLPLCRVWADCEAKLGRLDAARAVWNDVMAQAPYTGRPDLWLEFIELERRYGSCKHARKLYRRALERVWEGVESVAAAYERFEQTEGDVITMEDFRRRFRARMLVVEKRRAEAKAKEEAAAASTKGNKTSNKQRGKVQGQGRLMTSQERCADFGKGGKTAAPRQQKPSPRKPNKNLAATPLVPTSNLKRQQSDPPQVPEPPAKRPKSTNEVVDDREKVTVGKEAFTVFVSNLDFNTSVEAVRNVFEDCGSINHARLVRDFKGRSKGFGFVVFDTISDLSKALRKDRTPINGRPMFVSNYDPEKQGHVFKYSTGEEKDKLFVRGLPYSMTEEEIKQAFEIHASVKEIRLVTHRNGYSKGTCFIRFADATTAERVRVAMDQTLLQDRTITVLISNPSATKQTRHNPTPKNDASKASENSSSAEKSGPSSGGKVSPSKPGPSTTRRPTLAFKPRALTQPVPAKRETEVNGSKDAPKSNDDFRKLFANK